MTIPLTPVSGWWTAFTNDNEPVVIWRPYTQTPGEVEQRGPYYALSPKSARLLIREIDMALAHIEGDGGRELTVVRYPGPTEQG